MAQKLLGENLRLCEKLTSANMRIPPPLIHACVLLGLVSFEDGHSGPASVFLLITFYPHSKREKLGFIWGYTYLLFQLSHPKWEKRKDGENLGGRAL